MAALQLLRPVEKHGDAVTAFGDAAFAHAQGIVGCAERKFTAVVTEENDQRVVEGIVAFERGNESADATVDGVHHGGVGAAFFVFDIGVEREVCLGGFERGVRCVVGDVRKKG